MVVRSIDVNFPDPNEDCISTLLRLSSSTKSRNNSAESDTTVTNGESAILSNDGPETPSRNEEDARAQCTYGQLLESASHEHLPYLWTTVEGAKKDPRHRD
jgi:hypothetical protein